MSGLLIIFSPMLLLLLGLGIILMHDWIWLQGPWFHRRHRRHAFGARA